MSRSGIIYEVVNSTTGKSYIGQTVATLHARWRDHKSAARSGRHKHNVFMNAIRKYGPDTFECHIIEECEWSCLNEREQYWIIEKDTMVPNGYNLTSGGRQGSYFDQSVGQKRSQSMKGRRHSDETRQKISDANSGKNHHQYGRPLSEETKKKISKATSGERNRFFGKKHSATTRKKMSEAARKRTPRKHSAESRRKMSEAAKRRYIAKRLALQKDLEASSDLGG